MRQRTGLWVIGLGVGLSIFAAGCPVVLVGAGAAGTVAYLEGALKSVEPHPLDQVYAVVQTVLKEKDMKIVGKQVKEKNRAEVTARDEGDRKVNIILTSEYEGITNISIRIGVFGDESRSRAIYMRIHELLQK